MPLFALGGIGVPALQSLATQQVDGEQQGQLQGVIGLGGQSRVDFGPLFFSAVYFGVRDIWRGLIWMVGLAVYLLAIPLILGISRPSGAARNAVIWWKTPYSGRFRRKMLQFRLTIRRFRFH